jgi:hypothetical protein
MERIGIEPVTSGLQTHPDTSRQLTWIDRIGMAEPKSLILPNAARRSSTALRLHRARTAGA